MRKLLFRLMLGVCLIAGIMLTSQSVPHASASSHIAVSVPGCSDSDYGCGYQRGLLDGQSAAANGRCASQTFGAAGPQESQSDLGYSAGFTQGCNPGPITTPTPPPPPPPPPPQNQVITGCDNWDYSCGFQQGAAAGRSMKLAGYCPPSYRVDPSSQSTESAMGYWRAFNSYCI